MTSVMRWSPFNTSPPLQGPTTHLPQIFHLSFDHFQSSLNVSCFGVSLLAFHSQSSLQGLLDLLECSCSIRLLDHVLINQPKTRYLLSKYSGITTDREKIKNPKNLTQSEFSSRLIKEGFQALAGLLTRLNSGLIRTCPEAYRSFLSFKPSSKQLQLGRTGMVNKMKQIGSSMSKIPPIRNNFKPKPQPSSQMCVADILTKENTHMKIPHVHLAESELPVFPSLPVTCGHTKYVADGATTGCKVDDCRKASYVHPSVTPDRVLLWIRHYANHWNIHLTFPVPPRTIVYDNGCKLHSYCLNGEPAPYKEMRFFIDHFKLRLMYVHAVQQWHHVYIERTGMCSTELL